MDFRRILLSIGVLVGLAISAFASIAPEIDRAKDLYQKTDYEEAARVLRTIRVESAEVSALMGKTYYQLGNYTKATDALEKAVSLDPKNSEYYNWLGRVYGRRAETSSPFTAWSYAGKCRKNFEQAVELNPRNLEAIDDLFEFLVNAPGLVGGGVDKAAALAESARAVDLGKYYSLMARLAEKKKDPPSQLQHLQMALKVAPWSVGRIIDMARFLAKEKKYNESDELFDRAKKAEPENPEIKFQRAKIYIETGRNTEEAKKLLKEYLKSSLTPDNSSRSEAENLLKKIQQS